MVAHGHAKRLAGGVSPVQRQVKAVALLRKGSGRKAHGVDCDLQRAEIQSHPIQVRGEHAQPNLCGGEHLSVREVEVEVQTVGRNVKVVPGRLWHLGQCFQALHLRLTELVPHLDHGLDLLSHLLVHPGLRRKDPGGQHQDQ